MESLFSFLGLTADAVKKNKDANSYWLISYNSEAEMGDNMCLVRAPGKGAALLRYFRHVLNENGLWELADIFHMNQELPKHLSRSEKIQLDIEEDNDITYSDIEKIFLELNRERLIEILLASPTVDIILLKNIPRI